jgi:hypothetical protein
MERVPGGMMCGRGDDRDEKASPPRFTSKSFAVSGSSSARADFGVFRGRRMRRVTVHRPDRTASVIHRVVGAPQHDRLLGPTRGEEICLRRDGFSLGT